MAINVEVPGMGESVTEAILIKWHKADGELVNADEPLAELETDKANTDVLATAAGVVKRSKAEGDKVKVGDTIATIDPAGKAAPTPAATAGAASAKPAEVRSAVSTGSRAGNGNELKTEALSPAVRRIVEEKGVNPADVDATGKGGRLTKEDMVKHLDAPAPSQPSRPAKDVEPAEVAALAMADKKQSAPVGTPGSEPGVRRVAMSKIRKRIAENLVRAQQTAAILTTFNEVDLSGVMELRTKYKEKFEKVHGIGLGFMSFFAKATCMALKEFDRVNGFVDGDDFVLHDYVNLGIAVSTDRGLAVPVLRNAHTMSFAKIESEIKRLATATRDGKLALNELSGGTFTITNGGVFGSLLSTPILNAPQSGILGMHKIQDRAMVVKGQVVVRPMMYVALSYDHRIVDGKESVSFLVRVKDLLEDPARLMLEV